MRTTRERKSRAVNFHLPWPSISSTFLCAKIVHAREQIRTTRGEAQRRTTGNVANSPLYCAAKAGVIPSASETVGVVRPARQDPNGTMALLLLPISKAGPLVERSFGWLLASGVWPELELPQTLAGLHDVAFAMRDAVAPA